MTIVVPADYRVNMKESAKIPGPYLGAKKNKEYDD